MSERTSFHDGRVLLHHGDCLDVLDTLPENSVDSVVTDPPYHLTSIVKRFGANGAAPAQVGATGAYARASAGFMGKQWDGGDIAFRPDVWRKVLRVLKPGGHVLAFAGTRGWHRMFCAIEDAGFEIRDTVASLSDGGMDGPLMWAYASGFPKSHNVSKAIDRARNDDADGARVGLWLKAQRESRGLKQKDVAALWPSATGGLTGCVANWETLGKVPKWDQWVQLKSFIGFDDEMDAEVWRLNGRKGTPGENWKVIGERDAGVATGSVFGNFAQRTQTIDHSDLARQWDGWGTALKPAWEPICVARKPLNGTIAENVLRHGCGALNIDACRIPSGDDHAAKCASVVGLASNRNGDCYGEWTGERQDSFSALGRWPANLVLDGSKEAAGSFPADNPQGAPASPARFFFSAKANADDRIGSRHPTVKPVNLMSWLVRLVTPKGGVVLDPFAGSGTTGESALLEGMRCILIEREEEYCDDIHRRMTLVFSGEDEKRFILQKVKAAPVDDGPLFASISRKGDS